MGTCAQASISYIDPYSQRSADGDVSISEVTERGSYSKLNSLFKLGKKLFTVDVAEARLSFAPNVDEVVNNAAAQHHQQHQQQQQ
jgi:hypothetical protein